MAKITVVLAVYNVEDYLEKCIKSILDQSFKDIQILAIDDGSVDNSLSILKKYSKLNKKIKYISKENGGYGSVLEIAIKQIKTKYFLICDPDDWLTNDCLEKLFSSAEKTNSDITVADMYLVYGDKKNPQYKKCTHRNYPIKPFVKYTNLTNFAFFSPSPHAKLYRTKLAKKIIFPHKISYTDTILYYMYLNTARSALYIDEPLAFYYFDRPGNTVTKIVGDSYTQKTFDAQLSVINSTFSQLLKSHSVNYYIFYRLYIEITSIIAKMRLIKDGDFKVNIKKINTSLTTLDNIYSHIKKYIIGDNKINYILRKILMYFLLKPLTRKITIRFLANIYQQKTQ